MIGDGGYELTGKIPVQPGDTLTSAPTRDGKGFDPFIPGIYGGRILVFGPDGKVVDRAERTECRLYDHYDDPYDALKAPERHEPQIDPDGEEYVPEEYGMRVQLDLYEVYAGISSLSTVDRDLEIEITVDIDGETLPVTTLHDVRPKTLCMFFYIEKETADRMEKGQTYTGLVRMTYSDTGELYVEVPASFETLGG